MRLRIFKCLLLGVLAVGLAGCEPRPVVVDPDDGDTTIIEDDDDDVVIERDATDPDPGVGVDVNVGGGKGVDVDVERGADERANQNP